jgi:type I restriction enzyme S subunit
MNAERLLEHFHRMGDGPDAVLRLRRFILDLAVRGKLVPQDLEEQPASVLFNRITEEKARLVKAGEIRKSKPLPKVDDPPFDVPLTWRWTRIREVTSDRGQAVPEDRFTYIDVTAIDKENGVVADPKVLAADEAPSRARKITRKGDVIYSCVRPYLLNVAVIDEDFNPAPIASTAFAILNGHGLVLPRYLWIVLRSPFMVECVESTQRGQAYPAINDADFAVLPFPLPPLAEQHRIVAKVDELMALCDRLEAARAEREAARDRLSAASLARLNIPDPDPAAFANDARFALSNLTALTTRVDQVKRLRQIILDLAVRGTLAQQDPADEPASKWLCRVFLSEVEGEKKKAKVARVTPLEGVEAGYTLPASWIWMALGKLVSVMDAGWSPQCENHPRRDDSKWGVLKTTAVQTLAFDCGQHKELPAKFQPRPQHESKVGDILVTRAGPKNRVGVSCVVDKTEPRLMISDKLIRFRLVEGLSPRFFALTLNAGISRVAMEAAKSGMAVMQMNISQDKLRAIPVPLPPLAEQHRIVAKVDELMALCDRLEASLTVGDDTRRRLLEAVLHEALAPALDKAA